MDLYVRFERGRDDIIGPTFGPYEFVQLTYDQLRVGAEGETLAAFYGEDQEWVIDGRTSRMEQEAGRLDFSSWRGDALKIWYSDIIIFSKGKDQ